MSIPEGVVDLDGVITPASEAKISVFDRGFLYGDSAFEALRTYRGRPFRLRDHLDRLTRSCRLLRIPFALAPAELEQRVLRAIARSALTDCYLRIVVTRGVSPLGLDLQAARQPALVIYALALKPQPTRLYEDGMSVALVRTLRSTDASAASGAKASNYLAAVLALDDARQRGCDDAVILGSRGELLEGTTSNLFLIRGGELLTPALSADILEGITRRCVIELAREQSLPCRERELWPDDLRNADEVFMTSSVREIVPVVRVEETQIGDGKPGPRVNALRAAYRERTERS